MMSLAIFCFVGLLALSLGAYWLFVVRRETAARRTSSRRLRPTRGVAERAEMSPLNEFNPESTVSASAPAVKHSSRAYTRPSD
jgi:hypothetical protein